MCAQKQLYVGIDTTFLVAHTVLEYPEHGQAREQCAHLLKKNDLARAKVEAIITRLRSLEQES